MGRRHFRESIDISERASQPSTPSPVEVSEKRAEVTPTAPLAVEVAFEDLGDEVDEDAPTPPPLEKPKPKKKRKSNRLLKTLKKR